MTHEQPIDLLKVAKLQRSILWLILLVLIGSIASIFSAAILNAGGTMMMVIIVGLILLVVQIIAVIQAFRLAIAVRASIVYPILMVVFGILISWIGLIMLLVINQKATKALQRHGVKVGLLGVPKSEYPKFMPGHCRMCGYERTGLADTGACPECGCVPTGHPPTSFA